ncbi:RHS repeat-associated core domain-containing protein [Nitrospirillum sp. BR 11163]|uniref:RHS repeat-associated core domain-containing protein n=1 Tax=Nitrospirillum sp. BR 11163 TaxID=3104323 RepID=UPI002AFFB465|nr:RHS repeat-associated core domain-containing protein [Nitrospirillum sp. BR 11163]MEA1673717.1 RHS repeat-associated core domain-containing protein [Nitrospirillum sp. BR 11163]
MPAARIGVGTAVTPDQGWAYHQGQGLQSPADISDTMVSDLAQALQKNPNVIYDYVRNNITLVPIYGLQKGARGAIIDGAGTPFDQAQLMVLLLRASGYTANYRVGRISVSGGDFAAWFGITNADAARKILADGGFPATVNGAGTIGSVDMLHVWVQANINGAWLEFDPSFKTHTQVGGIDLTGVSGFNRNDFLSSAVSDMQETATTIRALNVGNVENRLQTAATNLANWIDANKPGATMDEIVGGRVIIPSVVPVPGTLPYAATALGTFNAQLPNTFRTKLSLKVSYRLTPSVYFQRLYYADEIYGREFMIEHTGGGAVCDPNSCSAYGKVELNVTVRGFSRDVWSNPYESDHVADGWYRVELAVDHPYPANNGGYMDYSYVRKLVDLNTPAMVVAGWGLTSENLKLRLERERLTNQSVFQNRASGSDATMNQGERSKDSIGATFLANHSRMSEILARVAGGIVQQHAVVGLVTATTVHGAGKTLWNDSSWNHTNISFDVAASITDQGFVLDVEPSYSVNSLGNDSGARQGLMHAVANASSTLEAAAIEETLGTPENPSATNRIGWAQANRSDMNFLKLDLATYNSMNPKPVIGEGLYYLQAGYTLLMSEFGGLGPGRSGDSSPVAPYACCYLETVGMAAVAIKDGNIAYVTAAPGGVVKGGEGGSVGADNTPTLNRADASADFVKEQAKAYPFKTDVNLRTGDLSYTQPADISVGAGKFPYSLIFQRTYRPGEGFAPGWHHNVGGSAIVSTSALDAMGRQAPRDAAATLAYALAAIGSFQDSIAASRIITASMAATWWQKTMSNNSVTLQDGTGADSTTYIRRPDGSFGYRAGGTSRLSQTGQVKTAKEDYVHPVYCFRELSFTETLGDGQTRTFAVPDGSSKSCAADEKGYNTRDLRLTSWRWPSTVTLSYTYTSSNAYAGPLVTGISNNLGRSLTLAYDPEPNASTPTLLKSVTDNSTGRQVTFSWDPGVQGYHLSKAINPLSYVSQYDYGDSNVQFNYGVNVPELTYRYNYGDDIANRFRDQRDQLTAVHIPEDVANGTNASLTVSYDAEGRTRTLTTKVGAVISYYPGLFRGSTKDANCAANWSNCGVTATWFDSLGRSVRQVDALGREHSAAYDGIGHPVQQTDPMGGVVKHVYDSRGRETETHTTPRPGSGLGEKAVYTSYDGTWNKPSQVKDARGQITDYAYDGTTGDLKTVDQPAVWNTASGGNIRPRITYAYDMGRIFSITDASGMETHFTYNAGKETLNKVVVDNNRKNLTTSFEWTDAGDLKTVTDPNNAQITATYNNARWRTELKAPEGWDAKWTYNRNGWITKLEQATGAAAPNDWINTQFAYTGEGRLYTVTDPMNNVTKTDYDPSGRPIKVTDALSRVSTTDYDAAGQKTAEHRAVGTPLEQTSAAYTYFADGQVQTITDPRGQVLTYTYDGFGRVAWLRYPDGASDGYDYDANDNTTALHFRDGSGATLEYDALNRQTGVTRAGMAKVVTGYDAAGRVGSIDDGYSGRTPSYDTAGRMTSVAVRVPRPGMGAAGLTMGFGYDNAGNRTSATWPDGTTVNWAYDGLGRVKDVTEGNFTWIHRNYDPLNRSTGAWRGVTGAPAISTSAYTYDAASRLLKLGNGWIGGAVNYTYSYDVVGQLTSMGLDNDAFQSTVGSTQTYGTANGLNGYTTVNNYTYGYDGRGNLTAVGSAAAMTYDSRNMLTRYAQGATVQTMGYYPEGGRAWKQVNGTTTLTLEAGGVEWGDYDINGNLMRRYIHASGAGGPGGGDVVGWEDGGGNRSLAIHDRQGSVIAVLNGSGQATSTYSYNAYGQSAQDGSTGSPYRYAGMRYDEIGLYVTPNRTYVPGIGRWLQMDPAGFVDGLNRYAYVGDDPLGRFDPSGLQAIVMTPEGPMPLPVAPQGMPGAVDARQTVVAIDNALSKFGKWILDHGLSTRFGHISLSEQHAEEDNKAQDGASGGNRIYDANGVGRIKDPNPAAVPVGDDELEQAISELEKSIGQRKLENDRYPRGNPNGNSRERADNISHKGHKERIRREQEVLDRLKDRLKKIDRDQ